MKECEIFGCKGVSLTKSKNAVILGINANETDLDFNDLHEVVITRNLNVIPKKTENGIDGGNINAEKIFSNIVNTSSLYSKNIIVDNIQTNSLEFNRKQLYLNGIGGNILDSIFIVNPLKLYDILLVNNSNGNVKIFIKNYKFISGYSVIIKNISFTKSRYTATIINRGNLKIQNNKGEFLKYIDMSSPGKNITLRYLSVNNILLWSLE